MEVHVAQPKLDERIFGANARPHLLHQAVVMQLRNRRAGTAATKSKGFVRTHRNRPPIFFLQYFFSKEMSHRREKGRKERGTER